MARTLQIWPTHNPLEDFRREIDALFARLMGPNNHSMAFPPVESLVDGEEFVVRIEVPGVDPKDVEVMVIDNLLTVRGSGEHRLENDAQDFPHGEMAHANFERSNNSALRNPGRRVEGCLPSRGARGPHSSSQKARGTQSADSGGILKSEGGLEHLQRKANS